jgi:hypothetical protein
LQHRCTFFAAAVRVANMQDAIPGKNKGMLLFTFLGNKNKKRDNQMHFTTFLSFLMFL